MADIGRTALVLGATGLVGKNIVTRLLESDKYEHINVLCRTDLDKNHKKIHCKVIDFDKLSESEEMFKVDDVFCCLGTTLKQAGSKENFRKVDFDYVLEAGKLAEKSGVKNFVLISSMGAKVSSGNFYSRTKGEIEEEIHKLQIPGIQIVRPSLLLGYRPHGRPKEKIAAIFMKILPGKNVKPITASLVAYAMIKLALNSDEGYHVYRSGDLHEIAMGKYNFSKY